MTLQVQRRLCATCIYRPDSALDLARLESQVRDRSHRGMVFFRTYRACHHARSGKVCCRGFWEAHQDQFTLGQLAKRLDLVEYVDVDDQ